VVEDVDGPLVRVTLRAEVDRIGPDHEFVCPVEADELCIRQRSRGREIHVAHDDAVGLVISLHLREVLSSILELCSRPDGIHVWVAPEDGRYAPDSIDHSEPELLHRKGGTVG
jgi:hypothetical protein